MKKKAVCSGGNVTDDQFGVHGLRQYTGDSCITG